MNNFISGLILLFERPLRALGRDTETPERFVVLPGGERLALFASGAGVVQPESGVVRGLSPHVHIGLRRGAIWNQLEVGDQKYSLTSGVLSQVLDILALHRLRTRRRCHRQLLLDKEVTPLWQSAVASLLDAEALPLLLVPTKTRLLGYSRVLGEIKPLARLLLTDRSCVLVAVSKVGNVAVPDSLMAAMRAAIEGGVFLAFVGDFEARSGTTENTEVSLTSQS